MEPATADAPRNPFVNPLLTDFYQLTMCYAYWKAEKAHAYSTFDMFFRKPPFGGEFAVFAGLEEVLRFVQTFRFTDEQIDYLRTVMPTAEAAFWEYLRGLDCSEVKIYGVAEGTVVFPRIPLLRVEGPLGVCQLLETTLLNLCNFATLVCTNAARHRLAAGKDKVLLEFGVRRAQGPDGAMSASRYSAIGGFDGTSNVLAGMMLGMKVMGTHAHALVSAFVGVEELPTRLIKGVDVVELALKYRRELGFTLSSLGELAAFVSFAQAFPDNFLALVDTYDTLTSGVPNYIAVALALRDIGLKPVGIRLDSGDLAWFSKEARRMMREVDAKLGLDGFLAASRIVASNDINEAVLNALNEQKHEIDVYGIGTNLVTCQSQPALGMVYKLVEINGVPRIKLSQEASKITVPARKEVYRLIGAEGVPILDLIIRAGEPQPQPGRRILCRHPFDEKRRAYVTPTAVLPLLRLVWKGKDARLEEALAVDGALSLSAASADAGAAAAAAAGGAGAAEAAPALLDPAAAAAAAAAAADGPASAGPGPGSPGGHARLGSGGSAGSHAPLRAIKSLHAMTPPGPVGLVPLTAPPKAALPGAALGGSGGAAVGGAGAGAATEPADAATAAAASPAVLPASALPAGVNLRAPFPPLSAVRAFVAAQLEWIRADHLRPLNPTPYKVSVSVELYQFLHELMIAEIPIPELE